MSYWVKSINSISDPNRDGRPLNGQGKSTACKGWENGLVTRAEVWNILSNGAVCIWNGEWQRMQRKREPLKILGFFPSSSWIPDEIWKSPNEELNAFERRVGTTVCKFTQPRIMAIYGEAKVLQVRLVRRSRRLSRPIRPCAIDGRTEFPCSLLPSPFQCDRHKNHTS